MASTLPINEFKGALLFLTTAGVIVPLFRRIRISPVIGFLLAGVAIGPWGVGALAERLPWLAPLRIERPEQVATLGELGVVFLLFMIGLEIDLKKMLSAGRVITLAAIAQILGGVALGRAGRRGAEGACRALRRRRAPRRR